MRARALLCGAVLLVRATGIPAEALEAPVPPGSPRPAGSSRPALTPLMTRERAEPPGGVATARPGSALELIEQQIRKNPPPLEPAGPPLTGPILGGLATAGCAVWALTPTFDRWGPEDRPGDYLWQGLGWGALQGFLLSPNAGFGWAEASPWHPDLRTEYGTLLDLEEGEREQRAYQILRKRAAAAKKQRVTAALVTVGTAALSAAVYYTGSALAGPNPNVKDFGIGYVTGIALGSLPWALTMLGIKSEEETHLAELEARRHPGGEP